MDEQQIKQVIEEKKHIAKIYTECDLGFYAKHITDLLDIIAMLQEEIKKGEQKCIQ